jgi:chemotaxis response regulator CheB
LLYSRKFHYTKMEAIVENNQTLMRKIVDAGNTCLTMKSAADWQKQAQIITDLIGSVTENLKKAEVETSEMNKKIEALSTQIAGLRALPKNEAIDDLIMKFETELNCLTLVKDAKPKGFAAALAKNIDPYEAARIKVEQKKAEERATMKSGTVFIETMKLLDDAMPVVKKNAAKTGIPVNKLRTVDCDKGKDCKYQFHCTFYHSDVELAHFKKNPITGRKF